MKFEPDLAFRVVVLGLALAGTARSECTAPIPAVELNYLVLEEGREKGRAVATLTPDDDGWSYRVKTQGRFGPFRVSVDESSHFQWLEGLPRPRHYQRVSRGGPFKRTSDAHFDWSRQVSSGRHRGDAWKLPLEGREVDRLSLQLAAAVRLARGETSLDLTYIDRGRRRFLNTKAIPVERLKTPAGEFAAIRVDRRRNERVTSTYHATDLDFLPVRVDHADEDESWRLELTSFRLLDCP